MLDVLRIFRGLDGRVLRRQADGDGPPPVCGSMRTFSTRLSRLPGDAEIRAGHARACISGGIISPGRHTHHRHVIRSLVGVSAGGKTLSGLSAHKNPRPGRVQMRPCAGVCCRDRNGPREQRRVVNLPIRLFGTNRHPGTHHSRIAPEVWERQVRGPGVDALGPPALDRSGGRPAQNLSPSTRRPSAPARPSVPKRSRYMRM